MYSGRFQESLHQEPLTFAVVDSEPVRYECTHDLEQSRHYDAGPRMLSLRNFKQVLHTLVRNRPVILDYWLICDMRGYAG